MSLFGSNSSTALTILGGTVSGAAMGFLVGGPVGAGIGAAAGGALAAGSAEEARKKERAGQQAIKQATADGIKNQNALVEQGYQKRKTALGIGSGGNPNPTQGAAVSQQGIALNAENEGVNLLG